VLEASAGDIEYKGGVSSSPDRRAIGIIELAGQLRSA